MIVLKQEGNLVFNEPVINNSQAIEQLQDKCLLNSSVVDKDYFKKVSFEDFNYEGSEYVIAQNRIASLKANTDFNNGSSFYDFENKKAYLKEYAYNDEKIEIYKFNLLKSKITQFFISGFDFSERRLITDNMNFDIATLINYDENVIDEISSILSLPNKEVIRGILYKLYPELAIFYYEIYPYITLSQIESYNIDKLKELRMLTENLRVSTYNIDQILGYLPMAEKNAKVLNLLKK